MTKKKKIVTQRFLLSVDIPDNCIPEGYLVTGEYRKLTVGEFGMDIDSFVVIYCSQVSDWGNKQIVLVHFRE